MIATVSTKGQVTIPVSIRKKYNIHPNDRIDFITEGDRIFIVPVKTLRDFRGAVDGSGEPDRERAAAKEALARRNVAEVVWVLESFYKLDNLAIGPMVKAILATPGLEVVNGSLVEKAIEHYLTHNIDFIDGYIAAVMERHQVSDIFSYDKKHLSRITAIRRLEP